MRLVTLATMLALAACGDAGPDASGGGGSGGGGAGGEGGGPASTCLGVLVCVHDCGGDGGCLQGCHDEASAPAWNQAYDLAVCMLDAGCTGSDCPPCRDLLDACILEGTEGLACPELASCLEECGDARVCGACRRLARPGAQEALDALDACAAVEGCTDEDCARLHCSEEHAACYGS